MSHYIVRRHNHLAFGPTWIVVETDGRSEKLRAIRDTKQQALDYVKISESQDLHEPFRGIIREDNA